MHGIYVSDQSCLKYIQGSFITLPKVFSCVKHATCFHFSVTENASIFLAIFLAFFLHLFQCESIFPEHGGPELCRATGILHNVTSTLLWKTLAFPMAVSHWCLQSSYGQLERTCIWYSWSRFADQFAHQSIHGKVIPKSVRDTCRLVGGIQIFVVRLLSYESQKSQFCLSPWITHPTLKPLETWEWRRFP